MSAGGRRAWCSAIPKGGPFDYRPAAVAASFMATGLDIYGKTQTLRQVYQIDAVVQPGNSGGPLVASGDGARHIPDGTVIGVVFARSTINPDVGYALAMAAVEADVSQVRPSSRRSAPVPASRIDRLAHRAERDPVSPGRVRMRP